MSTARSLWLGLLLTASLAGSWTLAGPAAAGSETKAPRIKRTPVHCDGAIQHPISVKARALNPVRRGEVIQVRVTATSRHGLERGEVRLASPGGASIASATRVPFGRLAAGAEATAEFAVRLPSQGHRFLLQFVVTGEGDSGTESRGATLNLLPDGPADRGRIVTSDSGERIAEYRARRVDR